MEAVFESNLVPAPGDSLLLSGTFAGMGYGAADPGIALSVADDGDSSNQLITEAVFIDDPAAVPLVINEIMADPQPGYHEWVEIYNSGEQAIALDNLRFSDSRDTLSIAAGGGLFLPVSMCCWPGIRRCWRNMPPMRRRCTYWVSSRL